MATKISEYSATPASNTDLDGINLSENVMVPSDVNDALRMQMAHLKDMDTGTSALTSPELTSATISGGTIDNTVIGNTTAAAGSFTNVTVSGTVDGRDVASDGTKLDGIEASADVTDATNVAAAGALMTAGGTMSGDLNFADNGKGVFGNADDLQIFHDGSNSYVKEIGTGDLILQGVANVRLQGGGNNENMVVAAQNGAVTLYHNNSAKLATTATGVNVTGTVAATAITGDGSGLTNLPSSGGAWNLISTTTVTSNVSTVDFTSIGTYKRYVLKWDCTMNSSALVTIRIYDNGSLVTSSDYVGVRGTIGNSYGTFQTTNTRWLTAVGMTTQIGYLEISAVEPRLPFRMEVGGLSGTGDSGEITFSTGGLKSTYSLTSFSGLQLGTTGTNDIATGRFSLYGLSQ